ncbi:hypothetical protein [Adlercreutzia murintestinalis]|uniref:hypothetical protein n=1 Tax=Adlercreutzia murintestinalis TaxID=2941325 RepID=UPI00203E0DDB|nr:hypothetical protein [Adlercreutzia murintestinalis]
MREKNQKTQSSISPKEQEQLGVFLRAFVEGNDHPAYLHPDKTNTMLEGIKGNIRHSAMSAYLGPIYWAYRKCVFPAVALSLLYLICVPFFHWFAVILLDFLASSLFFRVYRKRAEKIICKAKMSQPTREALLQYIKRNGGTSMPAAILAASLLTVAFLLVVMLLVWSGLLQAWYGNELFALLFSQG